MSFADLQLQGSEKLVAGLKRMIRSGRLFHGCLFEGRPEDTEALAMEFIRAVLCERGDGDSCGVCLSCRKIHNRNSEDVVVIGDNGTVRDKEVEYLISAAMKKSYTGRPVFLLIKNASQMTVRAQNRLLKTLEEPPAGVKLILLAENAELLAETIRSRCICFRLKPQENTGQLADGAHNPGFSKILEPEGQAASSRSLGRTTGAGAEDIDERADGKDIFSEEELARMIPFACDILYGRPFYKLKPEIEMFSSSKARAELMVSEAALFYRDILISFYGRSACLVSHKESLDVIEKCMRDFTPRQIADVFQAAHEAMKDLTAGVSAGHALKYMIFDIQEKLSRKS